MSENAEINMVEGLGEGTSRPKRSRQAPSRFQPSHEQYRKGADSRRASIRLEEQEARHAKEEAYLNQYTYDHVGKVMQEESPSLWIDVPTVQAHWHVEAAFEKPKTRGRPKKGGDVKSRKPRVSKKQSLLKKIKGEDIERSSHQVENPSSDDTHPNQGAIISPDDRVNGTSNSEEVHNREKRAASLELSTAAAHAAKSNASRSRNSAPDSPSPTHFVDASEEMPSPLPPYATNSSHPTLMLTTMYRYHPEMRLSHEVRESSLRELPVRSSVPVTSREVKKKKGSLLGQSLFLGSEGEDEEDQNKDQQTPRTAIHTTLSIKDQIEKTEDRKSPQRDKTEKQKDAAARVLASRKSPAASSNTIDLVESSSTRKNGAILQGRKKRKRQNQSVNGINYDGVLRIPSSSDDDLVSNLNVDHFVKSTGGRQKKDQRTRQLQRLRRQKEKAERKRQGQSSGETSESGSESDSDSDTTESIDEEDFIVDDEEMPTISPSKLNSNSKKQKRPQPAGKKERRASLTFSPPPLSIPKYRAYVDKLSRKQKLQEYIIWIVTYALEIPLEKDNERRLKAVRADLQDKFRMNYQSLLTQANRKQFTWYLTHFPQFERRLMSKTEKDANIGCHACRKKSQRCEFAFTFFGDKYNEKDLTKRDDDDHTSSALSTNGEDLKEVSKDAKKQKLYTFYLGETCAQFASVKHKIYHWERRVLNEIVKLQEFKELKRKDSDDIGGEHIDTVVQAYLPKLIKRYAILEADARDLVLKSTTSRQRLTDRWDLD